VPRRPLKLRNLTPLPVNVWMSVITQLGPGCRHEFWPHLGGERAGRGGGCVSSRIWPRPG
jgi:hypothetical protein